MTVKELIEKLSEMDENLEIVIDTGEVDGGCSTCGYGGVEIIKEVDENLDMETKVHITTTW